MFFPSERAAKMEVDRLRGMAKRWGTEGRSISASLSEDASRAADLLKGHEITLTTLARDYLGRIEEKNRSATFADTWQQYRDHLDTVRSKRGRHISEATKRNKDKIVVKLIEEIGSQLICDINEIELEKVMREKYRTPSIFNSARAHLSPLFTFAVKRKYCRKNVMLLVDQQAEADKDNCCATVPQISACISACRDHTKNKNLPKHLRVDASDALAAIVILCFSGIRPDSELPNLNWSQIRMDAKNPIIRIKKTGTKGRGGRSIPIAPNLMQWLESIPEAERFGDVAPANWRRKWQVVRKLAGFKQFESDILRHSYASYSHALGDDVNKLRSNLGHDTGDVLFNNYLDTDVEEDAAAAFWAIVPTENEVLREATA